MEISLNVDYRSFVSDIQRSLEGKGLMQPVSLTRFERLINREVEVHREVYLEELRKNWNTEFPGVAFSEQLLQEEVGKELVRARNKAVESFRSAVAIEAEKQRKYKIVFGWMFRKWDVWLVVGLILSISIAIPVWVKLFFTQSDLGFYSGGIGFLINMAAIALVAYKAEKERRLFHE